jgi:hypothetical protein
MQSRSEWRHGTNGYLVQASDGCSLIEADTDTEYTQTR